jgi:ectoine hydroxylase-related dioxygenase (phytanoyl-CoA dioxygenase family)
MSATATSPASVTDAFARDGYFHARNVYCEDMLRRLEVDFDRIVAQLERSGEDINARWGGENMDALDGGKSVVIHTHNVHRYSALWLHAFQDEKFLGLVQAMIGPDVVLHHSKLFQKPPRDGAPFPVHQDWWYFPTQNDSMVAATIFLGDADELTGGMRLFPGSHTLGRLNSSSGLGRSESLQAYPLEKATPINARRGDVLFFSYFTLHGSLPNRSANTRKTVLVQMYSGGDQIQENTQVNHVNEQLVLSGWNHHMNRSLAEKK